MTEFKGERYPNEGLITTTTDYLPLALGQIAEHLRGLIVSRENASDVLNQVDIIRRDLDRLQPKVGSACAELRPKLAVLKQQALNWAAIEYVAAKAEEALLPPK